MQFYYDNNGRRRGYSRSFKQEAWWNYSGVGIVAYGFFAIVYLCLIITFAPVFILTSKSLTPTGKAILCIAWAIIFILVLALGGTHTENAPSGCC